LSSFEISSTRLFAFNAVQSVSTSLLWHRIRYFPKVHLQRPPNSTSGGKFDIFFWQWNRQKFRSECPQVTPSVCEMTYNVSSGTLNPTIPLPPIDDSSRRQPVDPTCTKGVRHSRHRHRKLALAPSYWYAEHEASKVNSRSFCWIVHYAASTPAPPRAMSLPSYFLFASSHALPHAIGVTWLDEYNSRRSSLKVKGCPNRINNIKISRAILVAWRAGAPAAHAQWHLPNALIALKEGDRQTDAMRCLISDVFRILEIGLTSRLKYICCSSLMPVRWIFIHSFIHSHSVAGSKLMQ